MTGKLQFPTVRRDVPAGIIERLAAGARMADRTEDQRDDILHLTYRFPMPERMVAFAAAEAYAMRNERRGLLRHAPDDPWCGADLPTALWMADTAGWGEAVDLAVNVYDRLTATRLQSRIPVPVMAEEPGDEVDVASALSGDDPFVAQSESERRGVGRAVVVMRHSLFASMDIGAESIVTRGIVTAAVAHMLEASGVRVAIDVDMYGRYLGVQMDLECRIKDFGAPLDLPRVVYWLAHPSALRRVVFAVTARHFETHYNVSRQDEADWVRVGAAHVSGDNAVQVARATLAKAGIELG